MDLLHQAALVPALVVVWTRPRESGAWLLALAFAASWVGDSIAWYLGGSWAGFYGWVPVHVGLALLAVLDRRDWLFAAAGLILASCYSALLSFPGPEVLVITLGSVTLVSCVSGPMRWPVYLTSVVARRSILRCWRASS